MSEESRALLDVLHPEGVEGADADVVYLGSNPRETLAHYRILFPELISYRGGLFVEKQFDKVLVDDMFDQAAFGGDNAAIGHAEESLNGFGLLFEGDAPDKPVFDPVLAKANAEAIGWVWKRWIRETYAVEIDVVACIESVDACYVTFRSALGEGGI